MLDPVPPPPPASRLRRYVAVSAALCALALALALGLTAAVERAHPGLMRAAADFTPPLHLRRLDVHQLVGPGTLDDAVQVAARSDIGAIVNLAGGAAGAGLEDQLAAARRHGGRVLVFANLDPEGCCGPGWIRREAERLGRARRLGADGLAVLDEPPGADLTAPAAEPLWAACEALRWPVVVGAVGERTARLALVGRHRAVSFVAARDRGPPEAPEELAAALRAHENLWLDTAGRVSDLGRSPEAARRLLLDHADRVLFGSGTRYLEAPEWRGIVLYEGVPILLEPEHLGGKDRRIFFESTQRFFETRDARIPSPLPDRRDEEMTGIGLPRDALLRLYHRNAERLLGVRTPEVDE